MSFSIKQLYIRERIIFFLVVLVNHLIYQKKKKKSFSNYFFLRFFFFASFFFTKRKEKKLDISHVWMMCQSKYTFKHGHKKGQYLKKNSIKDYLSRNYKTILNNSLTSIQTRGVTYKLIPDWFCFYIYCPRIITNSTGKSLRKWY